MNEGGLSSVQKSSKVLALRGAKKVGKANSVERGKKTVTALCATNSVGCFVLRIFHMAANQCLQAMLHGAP